MDLDNWSCAWCGFPVSRDQPVAMHPKCKEQADGR